MRDETYRATLQGRTAEGERTTVIITRQGLGTEARVWLTLNGAMKTTVAMTDPEAVQLVALLTEATGAP